jgi:hypothetical protein
LAYAITVDVILARVMYVRTVVVGVHHSIAVVVFADVANAIIVAVLLVRVVVVTTVVVEVPYSIAIGVFAGVADAIVVVVGLVRVVVVRTVVIAVRHSIAIGIVVTSVVAVLMRPSNVTVSPPEMRVLVALNYDRLYVGVHVVDLPGVSLLSGKTVAPVYTRAGHRDDFDLIDALFELARAHMYFVSELVSLYDRVSELTKDQVPGRVALEHRLVALLLDPHGPLQALLGGDGAIRRTTILFPVYPGQHGR